MRIYDYLIEYIQDTACGIENITKCDHIIEKVEVYYYSIKNHFKNVKRQDLGLRKVSFTVDYGSLSVNDFLIPPTLFSFPNIDNHI